MSEFYDPRTARPAKHVDRRARAGSSSDSTELPSLGEVERRIMQIDDELANQPRKLRQQRRAEAYTADRSSAEEGSTDDSTYRPGADQASSSCRRHPLVVPAFGALAYVSNSA